MGYTGERVRKSSILATGINGIWYVKAKITKYETLPRAPFLDSRSLFCYSDIF